MIGLAIDKKAVLPGSEVTGRVRWEFLHGGHDAKIVIRLLWYTEGKGTEDCGVTEERIIEPVQESGEQRFSFIAPLFPWSYAGRLLSIVWAVEVQLMPTAEVCRETFVCAPGGREVRP